MILNDIIKRTKEDLQRKKRDLPLELLGRTLALNPYVPRDIKPYITSTKEEPIKIIAKVKNINLNESDFDPIQIAQNFSNARVDAISVVSEPNFFRGNIEYITQIRRYVSNPILREDFIVDKYQIVESLVFGADSITLIAKILSTKELKELYEYALYVGLEVLVELSNIEDLKKAMKCGVNIVCINHKNLDNLELDMSLCEKLMPLIPNGKIIVAKSGIKDEEMVKKLSLIGVDAFLIGEHLLKSSNTNEEIKKFKS